MQRDITALTGQVFDVLVVGGGIHGAAIARACSLQGLKTALVEQGDFGHATSANSLKIMHGGLRYLQHLNIKRMRDSILARREMLRTAPHYVKPLGCLIPNSGLGLHGNLFMRCALWINDLVGFDRNDGVPEESNLPPGQILTSRQCHTIIPGIEGGGCTGASLWYDALAVNSERLTLSLVQEAAAGGAVVTNYTELEEVLFEGGQTAGGRVRDLLKGDEHTVRARTVVNAAGPWMDSVQKRAGQEEAGSGWAKAVNIIVRRTFFGPYAVGLQGEEEFTDRDAFIRKKGRFFFFVPWRGYTMIGTTYRVFTGDPDNVRAGADDIDELVEEVNRIYPHAALVRSDVTGAHAGLVPMAVVTGPGDDVQLVKESSMVDHGRTADSLKGYFSVRGVKYTTALRLAEEACRTIRHHLGKGAGSDDMSASRPSAGEGKTIETSLPRDRRYLADRYGPLAQKVREYVSANDTAVSIDPPLCLGEIDYFLAEEMVFTLADVVFRRCELASAECPDRGALEAIARHMGKYFGWDEQRIGNEISAVTAAFSFS